MPTIAKGDTVIKVACLECIRGHRSSQCVHVNKVLIEVRKPGRPLNVSSGPASSQDIALAANLQPAYVVSGHSRCECPVTGIIPESDWEQTEAQPYPKGKNSDQAFRVAKSGSKPRGSRNSISRKVNSSQQESDILNLVTRPIVSKELQPADKPSCCQTGSREPRLETVASKLSPFSPIPTDKQSHTVSPSTFNHDMGRFVSRHEEPVNFDSQPFKVHYDTSYNNMTDNQFRHFLDSLSPAEMVDLFPWKSNPRPWSSAMQPLDSLFASLEGQTPHQKDPNETVNSISAVGVTDGCCCGDDCSCLGCAVHPANATTMDHVREATEFMQNDPHYTDGSALMTFEHVTAVLQARQESKQSSNLAQGLPNVVPRTGTGFVGPGSGLVPHASRQSTHSSPIIPGAASPSIPHMPSLHNGYHSFTGFESHDAYLYTGFGQQQKAFAIHPISGNQQVFVMSQLQQPLCVDDHGFCRCGPNCTCDGCQAHKITQPGTSFLSHPSATGDPLVSPSMQEHNTAHVLHSPRMTKIEGSSPFPNTLYAAPAVTRGDLSPVLATGLDLSGDTPFRFGTNSPFNTASASDIPVSWTGSPDHSPFVSQG